MVANGERTNYGKEVWKMLMLHYETDREEDSRYRNNKRDF